MINQFKQSQFIKGVILQFTAMYIAAGYIFFTLKFMFLEIAKDFSPSPAILVLFSLALGFILSSFVNESILKVKANINRVESPSIKKTIKYGLITFLIFQFQLTTMEMLFPFAKGIEIMSVPFFFPFFITNTCMAILFFKYLK